MNCADFDRWLDEGMSRDAEAVAAAHSGRCERCAAVLRAAREIDLALSVAPPPAPSGFAERVMVRVETTDQIRAAGAFLPALPATPWWVQIAADPATAGALVLLALVVWQFGRLGTAARAFASGALPSGAYDALVQTATRLGLNTPAVQTGLWLCLIPALAWGSFGLYRWTERFLSRRIRA